MQLETHVQAVRAELAAVASVGDARVVDAAERLSQALGATLGQQLLAVLSEAALEVNAQLPAGHVELRLAGRDPSLIYVQEEEPAPARVEDDDASARITLRLSASLKSAVETAAAREQVSDNTWIVKALGRSLSTVSTPSTGRRLSGFAQA